MTREHKLVILGERRVQMIAYLNLKMQEEDWHGVQDAASDLRDIDSEALGLQFEESE